MSDYNVKNIKLSRGHDCDCMQCDLYNGKKKIAEVWDDSYGGGFQYTWLDKKEEESFNEYVDSRGQVPGYSFNYTNDIVVDELVKEKIEKEEEQKRIKRYKNCIVIMKEGSNNYSYYKLKKNLETYSVDELKMYVNDIKQQLKEGEYIANTNLPF